MGPTISQQNDRTRDLWQLGAQVLDAHFDRRLVATNAPLLQDTDPTTQGVIAFFEISQFFPLNHME